MKIKLRKPQYLLVLILIFVAGAMIPCECFASSDDEWNGQDKALHVFAGFAGYTITYNYLIANTEVTQFQAKTLAACSVIALGAIKEATDEEFSWKDMGANGAGVSLGIVVNFEF